MKNVFETIFEKITDALKNGGLVTSFTYYVDEGWYGGYSESYTNQELAKNLKASLQTFMWVVLGFELVNTIWVLGRSCWRWFHHKEPVTFERVKEVGWALTRFMLTLLAVTVALAPMFFILSLFTQK